MPDEQQQSTEPPHISAIFIAESAGEPRRSLERAELVAGRGIVGDRYANGTGYWSDPRWPDQELTLVEGELEDALDLPPGALRRNLVTRGVVLDDLIGRQFTIGETLLEGVRPCDPCMHIEALTRPGLFAQLAGRGGLRARILRGGTIAAGDEIRVVNPHPGPLPLERERE